MLTQVSLEPTKLITTHGLSQTQEVPSRELFVFKSIHLVMEWDKEINLMIPDKSQITRELSGLENAWRSQGSGERDLGVPPRRVLREERPGGWKCLKRPTTEKHSCR